MKNDKLRLDRILSTGSMSCGKETWEACFGARYLVLGSVHEAPLSLSLRV